MSSFHFMLIHYTTVQCNYHWLWNTDNGFTHASRYSAVQFTIKLNTSSYATLCQGASLCWQLEAERGQKWQNSKRLKFCFSFLLSSLLYPLPYLKIIIIISRFFHWFVGLKCVSAKFKSGHKPLFSNGAVL